MTIPKPDLEDRSFDQLVEEARVLIPRYAPSWTDHNWSDPGITLIDLQAWITEAELYRVNLVTDQHRRKYLQLLGMPPADPVCARVDLTFEPANPRVLVKGTPVTAVLPDRKVAFEVDEDIPLANTRLRKVIVDPGSGSLVDRTLENEGNDLFYAPFGLQVQPGSAMYLGFDAPAESLSFRCYLYEKDLPPLGRHNGEPEYRLDDLIVSWEYQGPDDWIPISPRSGSGTKPFVTDDTGGFQRTGRFIFQGIGIAPADPGCWTAATLSRWKDPGDPDRQYFWLRCVVEEFVAAFPPRIETIRPNTATATEGSTIDFPETLAGSGLPRQAMKLKHTPAIRESIELLVDNEPWAILDGFDRSGGDDCHAVLCHDTGELVFGDGFHGRVPLAGSGIRVVKYRIGGGKAGNVRQGTEWNDEGLTRSEIRNPLPATGGADAESIAVAARRFLDDLRTPYPAVNNEDFEYLAKNTPGLRVWSAKALPGYHPNNPQVTTGATVTVAIIPFTPLFHLDNPPTVSRGFLSAVARHLDQHRLLCTRCCVVPALFVRVDLRISIVPAARSAGGNLDTRVRDTLEQFLHPIHGWTDQKGWPMGQNVYRSEIFRAVESVEGVRCSGRLILSGNLGAARDGEGNLILPSPIATVYAGKISVHVIADVKECRKKEEVYGTG